MADTQTLEIVIKLRDLASRGLKSVRKGLGVLLGPIGVVGKALFSLKGALVGLGVGISFGKIASEFLSVANSFEQMEIKLDQLTKGKGRETLDEINEWARTMPVNTQEAVNAFTTMQAYGLNPTIAKMETLVDVSTVMGETALPRVSRALGQMAVLGKVSAEELNQLSEVGVNARKYLADAFGQSVEEVQRSGRDIGEVIEAIWSGLAGEFGGASAKALNTWRGIMTVLKSYWTDFLKTVSDAGLFQYMKGWLLELLQLVQRFESDGSMQAFAESISKYAITTLHLMAQSVAVVIDAFRLLKFVWVGLKGVFLVFGEVVNTGLYNITAQVEALMQLVGEAVDRYATLLESVDPTGFSDKIVSGMRTASEALTSFGDDAKAHFQESSRIAREAVDAVGEELKAITSKETALAVVNKLHDKIIAKIKEEANTYKIARQEEAKARPTAAATPQAVAANQLAKITADTARALIEIESLYNKGAITAQQYYDAQVVGAKQVYQAELALLQSQFAAEKKVAKKEAINNKIYALEQKHHSDLFKLNEDRLKNEEEQAQRAYEKQKQLRDLQARELAATSSESEITTRFTQELLDMDNRHAEELNKLREQKAEMGLIEETYRVQQLEKDKLQANQRIELQKMILDSMSTVLGQTATAFDDLYNATGKKQKEFFYIAKAAAVSQAIIDTYKGATSAYSAMAGIPYVGPALGVAAAAAAIAAGLARVATIRAQTLAKGGPVEGYSPSSTADNIPIRATAGEFMHPVSAVQYYGRGVMEAIRTKAIPRDLLSGFAMPSFKRGFGRFATGGAVQPTQDTQRSREDANQGVTINNIVDPQMMDQHLVSSPGQRSVMNVLSENKYELKNLVLGE